MAAIRKAQILIGDKLPMNNKEKETYYKKVSKVTDVKDPEKVESTFYDLYKKDDELERFLTPTFDGKKATYSLNLIGFINYIKTL